MEWAAWVVFAKRLLLWFGGLTPFSWFLTIFKPDTSVPIYSVSSLIFFQ